MFKPIQIDWKGKPVTIPANRLLGAVAAIEEVITFNELLNYSQRGAYPAARIAKAYGELLRYAGEQVTDDEIYLGIFGDDVNAANVTGSMQLLMMIMVPPSLRDGKSNDPVLEPGETAPGNSKAAARSSSLRASIPSSSRKSGVRR